MSHETTLFALKRLIKSRIENIDSKVIAGNLSRESDRAAMILAGGLIDDALLTVLTKVFQAANSEEANRLFNYNGPIGSFSNRIQVAQAIGKISRSEARRMTIIKEIRNTAAHAHLAIDFDTPEIKKSVASLFSIELHSAIHGSPKKIVRNLFVFSCIAINANLTKGASFVPLDIFDHVVHSVPLPWNGKR